MKKFFIRVTEIGKAKIAASQAGGAAVSLTHVAVGDGKGNPVLPPSGKETELVREVHRGAIHTLAVSRDDPTCYEVQLTIPPTKGGFSIRELAVIDGQGSVFAYGNFPETYKPTEEEGAVRDMNLRAYFKITDLAEIQLVVDTNLVGATQEWVLNTITPAHLFPGGVENQVLTKSSNLDGHAEWKHPTDAFNIVIDTVSEQQTATEGQRQFILASTSTMGLAVYVNGIRRTDITVLDSITLRLAEGLSAGDSVYFVQNEPNEKWRWHRKMKFISFFVGQ